MTGSAEAFVYTTHLDRGLRIKFAAEPGPEVTEMMGVLRKAAPAAGTHMKYVAPNALMYYGANSLPPMAELWPYVMKRLGRVGLDDKARDVIEQIELALEVDFEADVLGNLGPEMAVVLEGFDMDGGPFPFPKATVLLQVKDKAKAQAFVDKIAGLIEEVVPPEAGLTVTELTHQDATLKVVGVPLPVGMTITPTIGLTENFLFISSGETYAKTTLNAAKGGVNLFNSALYRSLGIPEKTNSLAIVNMDELMKTAREVVEWGLSMAEMEGAGDQAKEWVDAYLLPLLDCLGAFKTMAVYGAVTPEGLSAVYIFRVEDIPAD